MRGLVIGAGEIGTSLYNVLKEAHTTFIRDIEEPTEDFGDIEVLNICIPPVKGFKGIVRKYVRQYKPKFTIVHSTVKPGTTRALGDRFVHSPVHGRHPRLENGIRTFGKYVGGTDSGVVAEAVVYLRHAQINAVAVDSPETSELSKILCTTYLTVIVSYMQEVKMMCDKYGADFNNVYGWNDLYNFGYTRLNETKFVRPRLDYVPGATGGHCCLPNLELIKSEPLARFLKKRNKLYGDPVPRDTES